MRPPKLRCSAHPARPDDEKNLRQNQIAQCQRLFERGALLFNVAFSAIEFAHHAPNCRASASLAHRKLAGDVVCAVLSAFFLEAPLRPSPLMTADATASAALVRCSISRSGPTVYAACKFL